MSSIRAVLDMALVLCALFAAPWATILVMVVLSGRWRAWEIMFVGFMMDCIYQPAGTLLSHLPLFTLIAVVVVWAFEPVRARFL